MTEIPIIWKIGIALVFLGMFVVCVFLTWRVLRLMERVKLLQVDRNELLEERAKQSNKLRLKGIEMDEEKKKKISDIMFRTVKEGRSAFGKLATTLDSNVLSDLEKKMILAALNMPEYGKAIQDPKTSFQVRKVYRDLKEKIKVSFYD